MFLKQKPDQFHNVWNCVDELLQVAITSAGCISLIIIFTIHAITGLAYLRRISVAHLSFLLLKSISKRRKSRILMVKPCKAHLFVLDTVLLNHWFPSKTREHLGRFGVGRNLAEADTAVPAPVAQLGKETS